MPPLLQFHAPRTHTGVRLNRGAAYIQKERERETRGCRARCQRENRAVCTCRMRTVFCFFNSLLPFFLYIIYATLLRVMRRRVCSKPARCERVSDACPSLSTCKTSARAFIYLFRHTHVLIHPTRSRGVRAVLCLSAS